ncbi:unnamed protein product, partial [marine sediment metagenome]
MRVAARSPSIADWVLRHAPRGGTALRENYESAQTGGTDITTWVVRLAALGVTVIFVTVIVVSTLRLRHWRTLVEEDPQAGRRASGLGSLRFVVALFLVPVGMITLFSWVETPFEYHTPEPLELSHDARI